MRFRLGRTVRLVIALVCLVLMIPFLMSKLDSTVSRSSSDSNNDVNDFNGVSTAWLFKDVHWLLKFFRNEAATMLDRREVVKGSTAVYNP
jgi:hypothetical protein